jgi:hypothetical protein
MAALMASGSGPLLPMQVVQPKPTRWKPMASSGSMRSASRRYSMTTLEPGASDVLTHGLRVRPCSAAFFASSPAATMTDGFDVLVQLVMAAMTTSPSVRVNCSSL